MRAQVSFVLSQSTRLTDGQTDRQTDRQKGLGNWKYRALHYMQSRDKNLKFAALFLFTISNVHTPCRPPWPVTV